MTLTLTEIARWHARQAKATTGPDRDFHAEAARLLRDLARRRAEHRHNITAALAKRKAQGKAIGRPRIEPAIEEAIRESLGAGGKGIHAIARQHGVGSGTVQRVKAESERNASRKRKV
jgi:DNA invertase Pin-like site-specific DNA recombinase